MKKVIITGANGFVGSNTVKKFLYEGYKVLAIDRNDFSKRLEYNENLEYIQCDISELKNKIIDIKENYDYFIHFAWKGSSGEDRSNYYTQLNNVFDTIECIKLAKHLGCKKFICAGTIMEYEVEHLIHSDNLKPNKNYIYGMAKYTAHCFSSAVASDIGIDICWAMITNTYGIGETSPRLINSTLRKILKKEELNFTSGVQNYDFVYIDDVTEAFYLIAEKGKPFCEYMIGSGTARPLKDFLLEINNKFCNNITFNFGNVDYTGINMPLSVFSIDKIKKDCGYIPKISFIDGIEKTLKWMNQTEE